MTATELKPYYRGPSATLYHGDCRDILPQLRERVDLIVSDPPYGMAYVAATIEGRCSIGIELEERYCQVAAERLQKAEGIYGRLIAA